MGHPELSNNIVEEFLFPNDYCLSLNETGPGSDTEARILKTRHNQILSLQRSDLHTLHSSLKFSRLKYSFFFPMLYVQTDTVKVKNKSLIDFTIRRHIKKLALFESGFHFSYDLVSLKGDNARVNLYVVPPGDGAELFRDIPSSTNAIASVMPLEQVLIELIHDASKQPVVSVWADKQHVMLMATQGKEILAHYVYATEAVPGDEAGWLVNNQHIEQFIATVERQVPGSKVSLLVWGEFYRDFVRHLEGNDAVSIDHGLEKKIGKKFSWNNYYGGYFRSRKVNPKAVINKQQAENPDTDIDKKKDRKNKRALLSKAVCREALFSDPLLFGLAVCRENQSMISLEYQKEFRRFSRSRYALMASLLIVCGFLGMTAFNVNEASRLQLEIEQQASRVEHDISRVRAQMPTRPVIDALVVKANMKEAIRSELNVANFLGWLTNITPEGAVINDLNVEEAAPEQKNRRTNRKQTTEFKKRYEVKLNLQLDQRYADSISRIDRFLTKVNHRINAPLSKFIHIDEKTRLPTELTVSFFIESGQFL